MEVDTIVLCEHPVLLPLLFSDVCFPWSEVISPQACTVHYSAEYPLQTSRVLFCSAPSAQGFQPVISTCLSFSTPSISSPNSRSLVDSTSVPSPCVVAWKFSKGSKLEHSLGSLHLFQESLPSLSEVCCLENNF